MNKNSPLTYLARIYAWRPGALATNTLLVTAALFIRALLQFILFVGLARHLGVKGYGEFVAVVAVMTFLVPMVGFGAPMLLVREVSIENNRFAQQFGKSLVIIGSSALPCLLAGLIIADWFLPAEIARIIVFNVALAELLLLPIIELSGRAFQAIEQLGYMMAIVTGLIFLRLLSFGIMILGNGPVDAASWSNYYLSATALSTVGALLLVFKRIGLPELCFRDVFAAVREGFYYALTGTTSRINGEIDKAFLARLTSLNITGAYSAAYRFTDIVMLPVIALLESSTARFFREGKDGMTSSVVYAKRILPLTTFYAAIGGLLLYVFADFIPLLLGPDYIISVPMLKWLAILPLILMIRYFFGMAVIAGGRIRYTSGVIFTGAAVNVVLNIVLIPLLSWAGAAMATIISEVVMILLFWLAIR